ncbi:hypothetical protein AURDEDRAFT_169997 [Auricularia subglabra TFB-10046 SS5]|uniref:Uncharacterized protein n=1 Tax=Auricularia subglabra (strain TFB-10046 / SS5) TaxID=717982 RepID=J0WYK7_AURST|nr:hypothetical protein AURDEDRAFT_169997 [Auricularia subglabra TFB-10046 SS5]
MSRDRTDETTPALTDADGEEGEINERLHKDIVMDMPEPWRPGKASASFDEPDPWAVDAMDE